MDLLALTEKRREHIQSCRDNHDKSHEIISDLYSDSTHFIYEILQNADDTGASEVIIQLSIDSLSIVHNGKKLFSYKDVESITTIGSSTKKDDLNSIGRFGAGFKSVFAITKTPQVHSGNFHFEITDFIVPEVIPPLDKNKGATTFLLPFNHVNVSSKDIYEQISERLQDLDFESLLFLRNIKDVKWKTISDEGHYSSVTSGTKAKLSSRVNDDCDFSDYFILTENINIDCSELNISVAYLLDKSESIVPVHDSKLFVFFPTNERTGLKFLVHAPYKTTPSRETIRFDDDQNEIITAALSKLIADSVTSLKDSGLLNVNALSMLPIDASNHHPLYRAAFLEVKSTFKSKALLPTQSGYYEVANNTVLSRGKDLSSLLDNSDCISLFNREYWLDSGITPDRSGEFRKYLQQELNVPEETMEKFCTRINHSFMSTKPDSWVVEFYSIITGHKALYKDKADVHLHLQGVLRSRPIIRLDNNKHINPCNSLGEVQVYFPTEGDSKFNTIKKSLMTIDTEEFFRSLGVEKPSEISELKEFILPKYKGDNVDLGVYTKDFQWCLDIWSRADKFRKSEIVSLLREAHFLRCLKKEGSKSYQLPGDVYFQTDKLNIWFGGNEDEDVFFIDSPVKMSDDVRKFLTSLGVKSELRLFGLEPINEKYRGYYKRSVDGFNPSFFVHGLRYALRNISLERSVLLWVVLIKNINKLEGYTEGTTNKSRPYNKSEKQTSKALNMLDGRNWLYDSSGNLISLAIDQVALADLNSQYLKEHDGIENFSKVLGLKLDEILAFEERTGKRVVSKERLEAIEAFEEQQKLEKEASEQTWSPAVEASDALPVLENSVPKQRKREDLSGQVGASGRSPSQSKKISENQLPSPEDSKTIGDWGEEIANRYLLEMFPDDDVVCLNKEGLGVGYDFVIKSDSEEVAYYEVKSKLDKSPKLFQVSGTQWSWAKELYNSERGDMYNILLISGVGSKNPSIRVINNPVKLWQSGELYADPVNIEI